MKKTINMRHDGFTLIEILMAVLVISILAVIGITQFQNFSSDAKNAATKANLSVMRMGISAQNALEISRCQKTAAAYPAIADIVANDITTAGGQCDIASLLNPATGAVYTAAAYLSLIPLGDRPFVQNAIPSNPWSVPSGSTLPTAVTASHATLGVCDNNAVQPATIATICSTAATAFTGVGGAASLEAGWCYCGASGAIWANSALNDGAADGLGTESLF